MFSHLPYLNVKDYGVTGDGSTDDVAAIESLSRSVSASGGGVLLFPPGTYRVSHGIHCDSDVTYQGQPGAVIKAATSGKHTDLGAFIPGMISGSGFNPANPARMVFPHTAVGAIALGDTAVTGASGQPFTVGDLVAVRSEGGYLHGDALVPTSLFFTKVVATAGDTITLADASPYTIPTPIIHRITDGVVDNVGEPLYMCENVSITGFGVDAHYPLWGGGAYGFHMSNIRPVGRPRFSSFLTLNALVKFSVEDCQGDWYYQFCELKLGSSDGVVRNCWGTYGAGAFVGLPVNFGESAHNIRFTGNTLHIGAAWTHGTKQVFDIVHCQDIRVTDNTINVTGPADSVFAVRGGPSGRNAADVWVTGNKIHSAGTATRYLIIGDASAAPPSGVTVESNHFTGSSKTKVGEWVRLTSGVGVSVRDNLVPPGLRAANTSGSTAPLT